MARPASPILQSTANTIAIASTGANTLLGSSGTKCAMASSNWFTLSTKRFLKVPVGVSTIVPMGTRAIFSAICSRIDCRALKAMPWLIIEERQVKRNFAVWPAAAAAASHAAVSRDSVPSTSPAANAATTT